jgi:antitoxin ParD1/3/4
MRRSTSVTLDEDLAGFIDRQIAEGRYGSASEVVRAALELHEAKLEALRGALIDGARPSRRFSIAMFSSKPGGPSTGR